MNEFNLINKYFMGYSSGPTIVTPNGDDCAILSPPKGYEIAMSMDTLVDGVHFDTSFSAEDIGYKTLAVNLSDLAAVGAEPAWVMLSLTLPNIDENFLNGFQRGFFQHFNNYPMALIGGDITRGPLSITIQVSGFVPKNSALKRSGANVGDLIYVTNTLGDPVIALDYLHEKIKLTKEDAASTLKKLHRPAPRIKTGIALRNIATSAIDISDGLYGDLSHILEKSKVGAKLYIDKIPLSHVLEKQSKKTQRESVLFGGDEYELCFTAPKNADIPALNTKMSCIGTIVTEKGIQLLDHNLSSVNITGSSYQHFNT